MQHELWGCFGGEKMLFDLAKFSLRQRYLGQVLPIQEHSVITSAEQQPTWPRVAIARSRGHWNASSFDKFHKQVTAWPVRRAAFIFLEDFVPCGRENYAGKGMGFMGTQSKRWWCHKSAAIRLRNQHLFHNDTSKCKKNPFVYLAFQESKPQSENAPFTSKKVLHSKPS